MLNRKETTMVNLPFSLTIAFTVAENGSDNVSEAFANVWGLYLPVEGN